MTAIKITDKMFSGGSIKNLASVLRAIAIDHATIVFGELNKTNLAIDSKLKKVFLNSTLMPIPLPKKSEPTEGLPVNLWDSYSDAVWDLRSIARIINIVAMRFGLETIDNEGSVKSISGMIFHDDPANAVMTGEDHTGAMRLLRESMVAIVVGFNAINSALGLDDLPGSLGGPMNGLMIHPTIVTQKGGYSASKAGVAAFAEAFNANLAFIITEWNYLVGIESEDKFQIDITISFDETVMHVPEIKMYLPQLEGVAILEEEAAEPYCIAVDHLLKILREIEVQTLIIAQDYTVAMVPVLINLGVDSPDQILSIEASVGLDITSEFYIGGAQAKTIINDLLVARSVFENLLVPINHALAMTDHAAISDTYEVQPPIPSGSDGYEAHLDASQLAMTIHQFYQCAASLANALPKVIEKRGPTAERSLNAVAG